MTIEIGQKAPDLELKGDHGETVKLSDYKGKYIVLYFYPKDMTPGCTTEACDFRDSHERLRRTGCRHYWRQPGQPGKTRKI